MQQENPATGPFEDNTSGVRKPSSAAGIRRNTGNPAMLSGIRILETLKTMHSML